MLRKGSFNNVSIYINWIPFNPICDFSWRLKDTRDSLKPIALQCPVLLEHATSNNLQYQYNLKHRINNIRKETSHWNNRSKKFPNIIFQYYFPQNSPGSQPVHAEDSFEYFKTFSQRK